MSATPRTTFKGENQKELEMDNTQQKEFENLVEPLIEWICKNWTPHTTVIVTPTTAELMTGEVSLYTDKHVKD